MAKFSWERGTDVVAKIKMGGKWAVVGGGRYEHEDGTVVSKVGGGWAINGKGRIPTLLCAIWAYERYVATGAKVFPNW